MTARIARTRQEPIEFYEYTGQPKSDWPQWLQSFSTFPESRKGRIATAIYDTPTGEPVWWRWFDQDEFDRRFEAV